MIVFMHFSYLSTYQLFMLVLALMAGICWTPYIFWSLAIIAFLSMISFAEKNKSLLILAVSSFFFFGATRYHQQIAHYFSDMQLLEKRCSAKGIIQEIAPRLDDEEQICMRIKISMITIHDEQYPVNKTIYLFLPHYIKLWVQPHQEIMIHEIVLQHPKSISYQQYLIKEGIWATAHQKFLSYTTIKKPSLFRQQINQFCSYPLSAIDHNFSPLTHSLYLSIFCGKKIKSPATTNSKKLFQYWGISHQLARSGLHLIILISLLLFLLSCIPCSAFYKQWIIILMLSFYYLITYPSVAFTRAFCMYLLYTLSKQLRLPSQPIHILVITTLLVLSHNPQQLFCLDFQLSFGITLLILWFCQKTQNLKTIAL